MQSKIILLAFFLWSNYAVSAQQHVFAFYEYDIKDGMSDQFVNGYTKDIEWHRDQKDDWSWIGWFVLNGDRRTRFIDATPYHRWEDFDHWKINGAENAKLNKIHWTPYVENLSGSYQVLLEEYSYCEKGWLQSNYLQTYHLKIKTGKAADFEKFLAAFKAPLTGQLKATSFVWMKTVSGGAVGGYQLFVALETLGELRLVEGLFEKFAGKTDLQMAYGTLVVSNFAELWGYVERLSLVVED